MNVGTLQVDALQGPRDGPSPPKVRATDDSQVAKSRRARAAAHYQELEKLKQPPPVQEGLAFHNGEHVMAGCGWAAGTGLQTCMQSMPQARLQSPSQWSPDGASSPGDRRRLRKSVHSVMAVIPGGEASLTPPAALLRARYRVLGGERVVSLYYTRPRDAALVAQQSPFAMLLRRVAEHFRLEEGSVRLEGRHPDEGTAAPRASLSSEAELDRMIDKASPMDSVVTEGASHIKLLDIYVTGLPISPTLNWVAGLHSVFHLAAITSVAFFTVYLLPAPMPWYWLAYSPIVLLVLNAISCYSCLNAEYASSESLRFFLNSKDAAAMGLAMVGLLGPSAMLLVFQAAMPQYGVRIDANTKGMLMMWSLAVHAFDSGATKTRARGGICGNCGGGGGGGQG